MRSEVDDAKVEEIERRANILRRHVIRMTALAGSGHPGGSLSAAEIVACLYFHVLRHDPKNPDWPDRDRFVLSKGHACPVVYAALAECGYFPVEELWTLRKLGSRLQGHPDMRKTPGVEMSTGSLGQGLSAAVGMALAGRIDRRRYHVYVLLGDGEIDEGQVWEAAMAAAHFKLSNLTAILDYNKLQLDGPVFEIMDHSPVAEKWRAFGWNVLEIDGHNVRQILWALSPERRVPGRPTMVVAHTVKGKGVSFMEGNVKFHGVAPTKEEAVRALRELGEEVESL